MAGGTGGFLITDPQHSVFHAFYLTLIVLTTVGMEAAEGHERIVATVLMIGGIFTTIYAAGTLVAFIIDGDLNRILQKRKLKAKISKLKKHYIIVGFGRMGQALSGELKEKGRDFVIIEKNEKRAQLAEERGYLVLQGDAHSEEVYEDAAIGRAQALATCLPDDADNVFVTLTARGLSETLTIIARTERMETQAKLIRAGADRVVCPPVLCASKVRVMMANPDPDHGIHAQEVSQETPIEIFIIPVGEVPALLDGPIGNHHVRTLTGMTILAIDRADKREMNPSALFVPEAGDQLVLAGTAEGMAQLRSVFREDD